MIMDYKKSYKKKTATKAKYKLKRGPLSKPITEEDKQGTSIHKLFYDFASWITRLFQYLIEDVELKEYVQSRLLYSSDIDWC